MSTTIEPEVSPEWHGEDVTIRDVLEALTQIRDKFSRTEAGDDEHPHPRSCVMTLISAVSSSSQEHLAVGTSRAISAQHPAQSIVIREDAELHSGHLEAWITTEVQRSEVVCATECEIVTLHVRGAAADHLDALVDPLLVSGVPTYLWWMGTPPFDKRELLEALRICDGLVVDSAQFERPYHTFRGLSELLKVAHHRMGLGDMQWARLKPWRESIAQFFTPRDRRAFLNGISEVGVDYEGEGRGNRIAASLMTGWMASALGWTLKRAAAGTGGVVVAHYEAGGRPIEVAFRSVQKQHLAAGELSAVRIAGVARGTTFRLSVQHDPERGRTVQEPSYRTLHTSGGEDDAGVELAERRAEWHRDVLHENMDSLHHTATGEAPGENRPRPSTVFTFERRRSDSTRVLLTIIEVGEGAPLRHVQQLDAEDVPSLLLDLLSTGTHDEVYNRSLASAAELVERF